MEKKIYIGSGKLNKYGIRASICVTDIPKEWIKEGKNGKKYLNINIDQRKEMDKFGNSHSISINTWTPELREKREEDSCPF